MDPHFILIFMIFAQCARGQISSSYNDGGYYTRSSDYSTNNQGYFTYSSQYQTTTSCTYYTDNQGSSFLGGSYSVGPCIDTTLYPSSSYPHTDSNGYTYSTTSQGFYTDTNHYPYTSSSSSCTYFTDHYGSTFSGGSYSVGPCTDTTWYPSSSYLHTDINGYMYWTTSQGFYTTNHYSYTSSSSSCTYYTDHYGSSFSGGSYSVGPCTDTTWYPGSSYPHTDSNRYTYWTTSQGFYTDTHHYPYTSSDFSHESPSSVAQLSTSVPTLQSLFSNSIQQSTLATSSYRPLISASSIQSSMTSISASVPVSASAFQSFMSISSVQSSPLSIQPSSLISAYSSFFTSNVQLPTVTSSLTFDQTSIRTSFNTQSILSTSSLQTSTPLLSSAISSSLQSSITFYTLQSSTISSGIPLSMTSFLQSSIISTFESLIPSSAQSTMSSLTVQSAMVSSPVLTTMSTLSVWSSTASSPVNSSTANSPVQSTMSTSLQATRTVVQSTMFTLPVQSSTTSSPVQSTTSALPVYSSTVSSPDQSIMSSSLLSTSTVVQSTMSTVPIQSSTVGSPVQSTMSTFLQSTSTAVQSTMSTLPVHSSATSSPVQTTSSTFFQSTMPTSAFSTTIITSLIPSSSMHSSLPSTVPTSSSSFEMSTTTNVVTSTPAIVTADPPSLSLTPQVVATRDSSTSGTTLEPVMRCQFPQPADDTLLYNIQWYINDNALTNATFTKVEYNNLNTKAALRPQHWTGTYRLNMNVNCSVSAQYSNSVPGSTFTSPKFFAGVKVNQTFVDVDEGQTVSIEVTSTLPVGCSASLSESDREANCKGTLNIRTTEYWSWCWNGIKYLSAAFPDNGCQLHFSYKYWYEPVQLNITGYMDGMRNWWYKSTNVKLEPGSDNNHITWGNMQFEDTIAVRVHDKDTSGGGICSSYNDPHMETFDGIFWENQRVGEFIMYRHKSKPFSVHALFSACVPGYATCNCGVAVKSGNSLYVVRTCTKVSTNQVQLLSVPYELMEGCDADAIAVQKTGSRYRVTLPNGVEVTFALSGWDNWISYVQIVAPSSDVDKTEGLCGSYNGDSSDDFIPRGQQSPVADEKTFAVSWRVPQGSSDSLFINSPTLSSYSSPSIPTTAPATLYCTCSSYQSAIQNPGYAHCQLESPTEPCSEAKSQTVSVCTQSRKKRSTSGSDDVIDTPSFSYDPDYDQELQVATWRNGWNESAATDYCTNAFTNDPAVTVCIEKVNTSVSEYTNSCITDIKLQGDSDFLKATLDTLKKKCITTASRDESFQQTNTTSNGVSVLDTLSSLTCPNNCSGHGTCANETCSCDSTHIGEDCSHDLQTPPAEISVPSHGLCDTRYRPCLTQNIVGVFHKAPYALAQHFKATENGKEYSNYSVMVNVTLRQLNLLTVTIPTYPTSSRRRRSTDGSIHGWDLSFSYDNSTFSNSTSVVVYNGASESCDYTTYTCTKFTSVAESDDSSVAAAAAGGVVGVLVAFVIIGVIVYFKVIKKKRPSSAKVSSSDREMLDIKPDEEGPPRPPTVNSWVSTKRK